MKTYRNLSDLLAGETPYSWGRALYKATDCGPWTGFVVQTSPERTEACVVEIRVKDGRLVAEIAPKGADPYALMFLGFDEFPVFGWSNPKWRSLDAYCRRAERFRKDNRHDRRPGIWIINSVNRCLGGVRVHLSRSVPAGFRTVGYEDREAGAFIQNCVGIRVGSIVEGSDVELEPRELRFPFTDEDLDQVVEGINDEACFYWRRDNTTYFSVRDAAWSGEVKLWCEWEAGAQAPEVSEDTPEAQALALKAWEVLFPAGESSWALEYGVDKPIPGTALYVRLEETPDITF